MYYGIQRLAIVTISSFILALVFVACCSSHTSSTGTLPKPSNPPAPDNCAILGRIVAIDSAFGPAMKRMNNTVDTTSPCYKGPCRARVRVDSVYGCGMGFPTGLYANEEITVYFPFTLSPTKDIFPSLKSPLPGLQTGSRFKANVIAHPVPQQLEIDNSSTEYTVLDYTIAQ